MALEPLLYKIRACPNIQGIAYKENPYKIAVYANHLLFYLSEPTIILLPNLLIKQV